MNISQLEAGRLAGAKAGYTTHQVNFEEITTLLTRDIAPKVSDLVLARVD